MTSREPHTGRRNVRHWRSIGVAIVATAACVVVGACSSSSGGSSGTTSSSSAPGGGASTAPSAPASSGSTETTTVNVGTLPIGDDAPLYIAIKNGYFAKQHLDVKPHVLQGGAAIASAVVGGSLQFGFGAVANLILARAKGLPLKAVASGNKAAQNAADAWSGILVKSGSPITSIKQLAGKTVAANARQGANELALDSLLLANGVKPSSVKVVSIAFPTMPSTLSAGHVDAVTEVEPFVSAIKANGGTMISPLFEGEEPGLQVADYLTTDKMIQDNPDLVKRFVTALNEALDFAQANPDAVRQIIPTYTKITAKIAGSMKLTTYGAQIKTASIEGQEALMHKLGWLPKVPPIGDLVWSGATTG